MRAEEDGDVEPRHEEPSFAEHRPARRARGGQRRAATGYTVTRSRPSRSIAGPAGPEEGSGGRRRGTPSRGTPLREVGGSGRRVNPASDKIGYLVDRLIDVDPVALLSVAIAE